jgi:hypothetical protein
MADHVRSLTVVVLVLAAAGAVGAATSALRDGPSTLAASEAATVGPMVAQLSTPPSTGGTTTGSPAGSATQPPTTGSPSTATSPATTPSDGTSTSASSTSSAATIEQIVSLTRSVDAGTTAATAFTVPSGRLLVVTDVVLTNPNGTPACGPSISAGGAPTAPAAGESGTGVLCVPPQTSLSLALTTGLEFAGGETVALGNAATPGATSGPVHFHLRGFLVNLGV